MRLVSWLKRASFSTGPGKYGVDTDRLCARAKAYCESGRSEFGDRKRAESEAQ